MKTIFLLTPIVAAVLCGCTSTRLQNDIAGHMAAAPSNQVIPVLNVEGVKGTAQDLAERAIKAQNVHVVRRATQPWIGGAMVPVTMTDGLPALFSENYVLDFGDGRVPLRVVVARLTKITNVPVRLRADSVSPGSPTASSASSAPATGGAGNMPSGAPVLSSLPASRSGVGVSAVPTADAAPSAPASAVSSTAALTVDGVAMRWNGSLKDFLDHLTNTLNMSWEYRDGAVIIASNVVETHPIAGILGTQTFDNSIGVSASGNAGANGSSSSLSSNETYSDKGNLDTFTAIVTTVRGIVGAGAGRSVTLDAAGGGIVVVAPKDVQSQVRDYLREKNKMASRMISVTLDIYAIKQSQADQQGLNWNVIFNNLAGSYRIGSSSPASLAGSSAASFTITNLAGESAGSNAILAALSQSGNSVQHKPVTLTTLNGVLKVQSSTSTQGYVKSTTPGLASASGSAGAPGLNTDTITTGDVYSVLPIIQPDNSVLLKYSFRLSNLLSIANFTSGTGASQQTVQVPQTDSVGDGSRVRLAPGEALMITGLSRFVSSSDGNRLTEGAPMALGGSTNNRVSREHVIVVVRATPISAF